MLLPPLLRDGLPFIHYSLILNANLDMLLASWDNVVLLLALQGWQLINCLGNDLKSGLDLFL